MDRKLLDGITEDLKAFIDRQSSLHIQEHDIWARFSWQYHNQAVRASFHDEPHGLVVRHSGESLTYQEFLSLDKFGNGPELAQCVIDDLNLTLSEKESWVEPRLTLKSLEGDRSLTSIEDLATALADGVDPHSTNLFFLTGDAGAGKTHLLRRLAHDSAIAYLENRSPFFYVCVSATGRALAQFNDALSGTLDDIGAPVRRAGLLSLLRSGVVRLIVDGFDELVGGQGSYAEAFGALADLIGDLNGKAVIVAAARSVYYEQRFRQKISELLDEGSLDLVFAPLDLLSWNRGQIDAYLTNAQTRGMLSSEDAQHISSWLERQQAEVLWKPLFVDKIVESKGHSLDNDRDPIDWLIDVYVERECATKLVGANQEPLLTSEQFSQVLQEFARAMWDQEVTYLTMDECKNLASDMAEIFSLSSEARKHVVEAMESRACLQKGPHPQTVVFEHELFMHSFLGREVADRFSNVVEMGDLVRSREKALPPDAARAAASRLISTTERQVLVDTIGGSRFAPQLATVTADLASHNSGRDLVIRQQELTGLSFAGNTLQRLIFENCILRDIDLRGTAFVSCAAKGTTFVDVILSPTSRLELEGAAPKEFSFLLFEDEKGRRRLRGESPPGFKTLGRMGLHIDPEASTVPELRADVEWALDYLNRYYMRSSRLSNTDRHERQLFDRAGSVMARLVDLAFLTTYTDSSAGQRATFYKRSQGFSDLLERQNPSSSPDQALALRLTKFYDWAADVDR